MVSLIIPHYNRADLLIKNLYDMGIINFPNVEVIIVDDKSDKIQVLKLRGFSDKCDFIHLIENDRNCGPGFCRNLGLEKANCDYIVFLDSDDKLNLNELQNLEQVLCQERHDAIVFYNYLKSSMRKEIQKYDMFNLNNLKLFLKGVIKVNNIHISCLLLRKSFLLSEKIFFPVKIRKSEDTLFKLKLLSHSPKLMHIESLEYFFFWNDEVDSLTRNVSFKKRIVNHLHTIRAMFSLYALVFRNNEIGWITPLPRVFNSIMGIAKTFVHYLKVKLL
jgi:glycosyltransferase involved in cell wall biosynthesis